MSSPESLNAEALLRHGPWLAQLARALVARDDEIDDVVQQTLTQALATTPVRVTNLRSWLGAIARNVVRASRRSDFARATREESAPLPASPETPDELVARAELRRKVVEAVLALAEPYRSAVIRRFFEEQEVAQIADLTNAPQATVRTRIRRGVEQVRKALQQTFGCDEDRGDERASAARSLLFARLGHLARDGMKGTVAGGSAVFVGRVAMSSWWKWTAAAGLVVAAAAYVTTREGRPHAATSPIVDARQTQPPSDTTASSSFRSECASREPELHTVTSDSNASKQDATSATANSATSDGGIVRGVVRDESGQLVSGAMVYMSPSQWDDPRLSSVSAEFERLRRSPPPKAIPGDPEARRTGVSGGFEFSGVSMFRDWVVAACDPERGAGISESLHFNATRMAFDVEIDLIPPVVLRGIVTDPMGRPIADARLAVTFVDPPFPGIRHFQNSSSGSTGAWSCTPTCTRHMEVEASAIGCARMEHPRAIDFMIGQHEAVIDLVLEQQVVDPNVVTVSGPIIDDDGRTIDLKHRIDQQLGPEWTGDELEGRLEVYAIEPQKPLPAMGHTLNDASALGPVNTHTSQYEISLVRAFRGTLVLTLGGRRRVVGMVPIDDLNEPPALPFNLSAIGPPVETATLIVSLVDAKTGEPVDTGGVGFAAIPALPEPHLIAPSSILAPNKATNLCEFTVPLGRVTIQANRTGYIAGNPEVVFTRPGERIELTMKFLPADAKVRGRVLQQDGTADTHARVRVYRAGDNGLEFSQVATTNPNADGRFEITRLASEDYFVFVDFERAPTIFARTRAASPPPELELRSGVGQPVQLIVRGLDERSDDIRTMWRVLDSEGMPVYDGMLSEYRCGLDLGVCVAPGHYRAFVWCRNHGETTVEFDAPATGPIDVSLDRRR